MRLPKKGEKGFTLIELLIVVAILGVLAAVIIPNVGQFIGAGETEARKTEFSTIQTSVHSMMVDNGISSIPAPAFAYSAAGAATNNMAAFPDSTSSATVPAAPAAAGKVTDPDGTAYTYGGVPPVGDKAGYLLYGHDITGDNEQGSLVNYAAMSTGTYYYTCESDGTIRQFDGAAIATAEEFSY